MKNQGALKLIELILTGVHPKDTGVTLLLTQHGVRGSINPLGTQFTGWDEINKEMVDVSLTPSQIKGRISTLIARIRNRE